MTSSRKLKAAVGLAGMGMLAAACGGGSSSKTNTTSAESAFNKASEAIINPSTKKGGTLKLGAIDDFDSLDPGRTYYGYSWDFRRLWDRQMFQLAPGVGKASLKVAPDLATGDPEVSSDGLTYTYKMRSGVKFANGDPVTSKTEKYAIERIFDQDVISGGPTYLVDLLDPKHTYPGPYKDKAADHLGLKTIETPDDTTIIFKIAKPFSDMNYLLALPTSTPVPIAVDQAPATGGDNYQKHPISAGPYQVDSYQLGKSLKLSRNPNWDAKTDPLHKALPDNIDLTIGIAPETADQQLLSGQLDFVLDAPLGTAARSQVLADKKGKGKYADAPVESFSTSWIDLDPNVKPFDNIDCRKAVAYAMDKKSIQDVLGGPLAGGDIANTVTSPASPSFEADYNPYPVGADNHGDLTKSKAALTACGKPGGFSTKLIHGTSPSATSQALAIENALKRVGITAVDVVAKRGADARKVPAQVKAQGLGIILFGWGADFPTDYGFWEFVADPRQIPAKGNYNEAEFNDPKATALIDKALSQTGADQAATWKEFSHLVMDSATMIPYLYPREVQVHSPRATNVTNLFAIFNYYDFMNVGVL